MNEAIRICAVLLRAGAVSRAALPELERPEVRREVERRLQGVGLVLATSPWSDLIGIRLDPEVAADPAFETAANLGLGDDACALLVVLWVRLVLDRSGSAGGESPRPLVRMDTLARELRPLLGDRRHIRSLVAQLRQLGLLAGQGDVIEAGPLLELAIDRERMIAFLRAGVLADLLTKREKQPERGTKPDVLSGSGSQLLDILRKLGGSAGMTELVRETGAPASRLRLVLRALAEAGHVRRSGERRSARYHVAE